ncbi:hypothetical protein AnigIFM59636_008490 [Aspergillus niger]|nr:hypothetical protein AnigIFM59636_008490 [Aspergillus niger]
MTVRDTVLLLVSVGRFSCFGYRAASLREYDLFFRTSIEGACSGSLRGSWLLQSQTSAAILFEAAILSRVRYISADIVSLFETSSLRGSGRVIPAAISFGVRFILADIVSLFEIRWSAKPCSSSLRGSGLQPLAVSPRESVLLLVCACAGSLREFRLVIFSIDRLNPPPPSASVSPPPSKFAMSQPEIADRFPSPLQKSEYDSLSVLRRNILSLKNANFFRSPPPARPSSSSPLTTSIKYHASPTRTNPGIEIAMRKVQEDRLEWEHDMIANLSDFLIEEVDHQLQDTRSKGSFWYMKSTYNDIPIRAVRHLRRDGPAAKVLPYKIDKARLAFKRVN